MIDQPMQNNLSTLIDEAIQLMAYFKQLDWLRFLSVFAFIFIVMLIAGCLLLLNDYVAEYYQKRRLRSHTLHISNQGNVPSVFLLRTLNLPGQFAIRFRMNNAPMIWVTRKDIEKSEKVELEQTAEQAGPVQEEEPSSCRTGLIPDLNRPMIAEQTGAAVAHVRKTAENVGRKAGVLASVFSTFSYLSGGSSNGIKKAVSALKGVQQSVQETIAGANTVVGQTESLKRQIGSLAGPAAEKLAEGFSETARNAAQKLPEEKEKPKTEEVITEANFQDLFTYDEDTWKKNIYRQDADGGALIYAQSKELVPGETMDITLEIMNLSGNDIAGTSMLYQVEVIQIPQSQAAVSSIRHRIHGIVIFQKISLWTQFSPFLLMAAAVALSIIIVLRCSYAFL